MQVSNVFSSFRRSRIMALIALVVVVAVLPFSVLLIQHQLAYRQHATTSLSFVTRSGSDLLLNGRKFRFAGANIHWLGRDDANNENYPSHSRIENVFEIAQQMGATVIRSQTLGISVGCPNCIEPRLNQFNNQAFEPIDYAIKTATAHNIHLIIPLVDNYHYYMGGKHTFTDWRGINDENQFYYNKAIIQDFKNYIAHILTHVNQFTGIALKDDPVIMAWETGNELFPPSAWTKTIADYLKNLSPKQLVIDGRYGIDTANLTLRSIDMYSDHFYPRNVQRLITDANLVAQQNKVFFVGEYDWTNISTYTWESTHHISSSLSDFLSAIETNKVAGDLFWQLYDRGYTNDEFTLHYPGDTTDMQSKIQMLTAHAAKLKAAASTVNSPGDRKVQ